MLQKNILTAAVFTFLGHALMAQGANKKISGAISDARNTPLPGATVSLLLSRDSSLVKTTTTDDGGGFVFKNLKENSYVLACSYTGYSRHISAAMTIDHEHPSIVLPVIVLTSTNKTMLQAVVVTAKKPLIEQKIDRTIVNVDAMITATGGNALEALGKSPGVTIDNNGNIRLNGISGVLVLIDEKPTYMSSQDLTAYLNSLPAGLLDRIELMSNPPARYEASGGAIINIVLKKNKMQGFNGNLSAGYTQGWYPRSADALVANYRVKKMNIFGNIGYNRGAIYIKTDTRRYFYQPDGSPGPAVFTNTLYTYRSDDVNARAGMDYQLSSNTTAGILLSGGLSAKPDRDEYSTELYNAKMQPDSMTSGYTARKYTGRNESVNLNVQHTFGSRGASVGADLDYIYYHSGGNEFLPLFVYLPDGSLINSIARRLIRLSDINIYSAKTDYSLPLKGKARFDAGAKTSSVDNRYHSDWYDQLNNNYVFNPGRSNYFIYNENTNAAYANATKEWKRWSIQAGLRLENTNLNGHQVENAATPDSVFSQHYTRAFPSFYLSYKLDSAGNHTLILSASERIRRPNYQQLNPFLAYRDNYTYTAGNPLLKPHYNKYVELKYAFKHYAGFSISYFYLSGLITGLTQAEGNVLISRPQNFGINASINFMPYVSIPVTGSWDLNGNMLLFYLVNKGTAYGQNVDNNIISMECQIVNQFRWHKVWSAEISSFYSSRHIGGQGQGDPFFNLDAGIQKMVFRGNGTLRMKVDDVFKSSQSGDKLTGINGAVVFRNYSKDSRRIGVSFSYRFGKAANARKSKHNSGGAEDEKGRAN